MSISPVSYINCWKLSVAFTAIDIIPQLIMAVGVAVIHTVSGIFVEILALSAQSARNIMNGRTIPEYVFDYQDVMGGGNRICVF